MSTREAEVVSRGSGERSEAHGVSHGFSEIDANEPRRGETLAANSLRPSGAAAIVKIATHGLRRGLQSFRR